MALARPGRVVGVLLGNEPMRRVKGVKIGPFLSRTLSDIRYASCVVEVSAVAGKPWHASNACTISALCACRNRSACSARFVLWKSRALGEDRVPETCIMPCLLRKVDRQRSDHRRLFHAGSDRCYDWAKIADFKIADPQALLFDECYWVFNERYWVARAIIEIRLMLLFGIGRLDGYSAYITLPGMGLGCVHVMTDRGLCAFPGDALRSLSRRLAALIKETLIHTLSELMDGNGTDLWTIHSDRLQELQLVIEKEVKLFCGVCRMGSGAARSPIHARFRRRPSMRSLDRQTTQKSVGLRISNSSWPTWLSMLQLLRKR